MARNIGMDNDETFRAVTLVRYADGSTYTRYEGPYAKPGPANARVSFWRNYYSADWRSTEWVDGWIERSVSHWERVSK